MLKQTPHIFENRSTESTLVVQWHQSQPVQQRRTTENAVNFGG